MIQTNPEAGLLARLAPICSDLYDILEEAALRGRQNLAIYDTVPQAALTNFTRFHLHLSLCEEELPGWRVRPNVNNGGTHLLSDDSMVVVRFRHKPGPHYPATGHSLAQRRYWQQEFQVGFFPERQNLVAAWYFDSDGEAHIELYRPREVWTYGNREIIDLRFELPRESDELEGIEWVPMEEQLSDEMFMEQAPTVTADPVVAVDDDE